VVVDFTSRNSTCIECICWMYSMPASQRKLLQHL